MHQPAAPLTVKVNKVLATKKIVKKDAPSYPEGSYIQIIEESTMEKRSDDRVTDIKVQESTNLEHRRSSPEKDLHISGECDCPESS